MISLHGMTFLGTFKATQEIMDVGKVTLQNPNSSSTIAITLLIILDISIFIMDYGIQSR